MARAQPCFYGKATRGGNLRTCGNTVVWHVCDECFVSVLYGTSVTSALLLCAHEHRA